MADAFSNWRPRDDQPDRYDQQWSFYHSQHTGVTFLTGGNGAGTSETALAKVADFIQLKQEAPRRDTPFWIIGAGYDQVIETAWKEKLLGHGHIRPDEVDWARIKWHDPRGGLPIRVPMKPWPNGNGGNWVLEFKSYDQGREAMQARSIGGFLFIEQFPWVILEEVLRGCREYNFPGSKLCEFTPVDPVLSIELEEMLEEDSLPPGWAIYRANTECAMEAGHVSPEWFQEFFGMIPEEMRETRMTGQFATYEGTVFQNFNPLVHLVGDDEVFPDGNFPKGVWYRRAIDWGSGPENAFCCLWAYKNGLGQYFFYDEYYSTDQTYTVHDHLKEICDRWPWPAVNPYFGMTYADPSEPGYIRIASRFEEFEPDYPNINIQNANNRVYEGIDHVRYMLKSTIALPGGKKVPKLFIHRKNCPNLSRQFRTYRWEKSAGTGINPRDAKPRPLKKDDHAMDAARYLLYSDASKIGHTPQNLKRDRSRAKKLGINVEG